MSENMPRLIRTHRRLTDSYQLCRWWQFVKRRKLQRSINSYTNIILNHLAARTEGG